jgi:hypothetical protein
MKKNTIINLALLLLLVAGFLFAKVFQYYFFGYYSSGAATALLVLNYLGRRQLDDATKRIDKLMKDQQLANELDNDNFNEDD